MSTSTLNSTQQYVSKHYEYARKAGERFRMDPLVILAQAAHESAWGSSSLAKNQHNFFGITAAGSPNEFWKGDVYQSGGKYKLKFRVYPSAQDSFYDFARLIASKYKTAHAVATNYKDYATKISQSPYISESNGDNRSVYKNAIISMYEKMAPYAGKIISQVITEPIAEVIKKKTLPSTSH